MLLVVVLWTWFVPIGDDILSHYPQAQSVFLSYVLLAESPSLSQFEYIITVSNQSAFVV